MNQWINSIISSLNMQIVATAVIRFVWVFPNQTGISQAKQESERNKIHLKV